MSTEIARISDKDIYHLLETKQSDIIRFIGEDNFKREISFAIQAANSNKMLSGVDPKSVAKAIFNLSITGLSLNPVTKLAYLVPKYVGGQWDAILMPSYQGLVKLICDCGAAKLITAHVVYEGDTFTPSYGSESGIVHIPRSSGKGKTIIAVYAVAEMMNGAKLNEVMWKDEIDEIRDRSDSYKAFKDGKAKSAIWEDWYSEMARKTVIKRIWKYIPKSKGYEKVSEAVEIDNQDYPASIMQLGMIESLLQTSSVDHDQRERIERELEDMSHYGAQKCIAYLQDNQLNRIESGGNYSETDIAEKVADKMADEKA